MSSTCFEPEGSPTGRRLYIQVWYGTVTFIGTSSLMSRRVCSKLMYEFIKCAFHWYILYNSIRQYEYFHQSLSCTLLWSNGDCRMWSYENVWGAKG